MNVTEQMIRDISTAYGSVRNPSWSFAERRYQSNPYSSLAETLRPKFVIRDVTDLNEDVSVCLSLQASDPVCECCLRLSLVGPYACISTGNNEFQRIDDLEAVPIFRILTKALHDANVTVLGPSDLREVVMFGDEFVSIYGVLFSADEAFF